MSPAVALALPLLLILPGAGASAAGQTVTYRGELDAAANERLFRQAKGRVPGRLVIRSGGGAVEAAITLARWVHDHGIHVVVDGYCLSACANYVFPAGRRKVIRPGAVVAWHGSYRHLVETGQWRDDARARMDKYGEDPATAEARAWAEAERLAALEDAFYEAIGVDGYLAWVGKMPPYEVPDYYTLPVADMARFGLTGVEAPPGYPPADLSHVDARIAPIELDEAAIP